MGEGISYWNERSVITLQSMTGFARVGTQIGHTNAVWESRSVNGKNLDIRFRSTIAIDLIENELKKKVSSLFARGNVGFSLTVTFENGVNSPIINHEYLGSLLQLSEQLERDYGFAKPSIDGILALKGVIEHDVDKNETIENAELKKSIYDSFDQLLVELKTAREAEGASLYNIISEQLDTIEKLVDEARQDPSRSREAIHERLKTTVEALLETNAALDPQRLHMEAVLVAMRVDIQEELDRLSGHIKAARKLISLDEPIGRRLDFLAQEFNREANTLCSKAHTTSLSSTGLALKAVIDQLREQIQNIE